MSVRELFGLDDVVGCTPVSGPIRWRRRSGLTEVDSLWALFLQHVAPTTVMFPARNTSQILILSSGGVRYDIFAGNVTRDDTMIVSPFRDGFNVFRGVDGNTAAATVAALEAGVPGQAGLLPSFLATACPNTEQIYDILAVDYDVNRIAGALEAAGGTGAWVPEGFRRQEIDTTSIWESWVSMEWAQNCETQVLTV
eukprot:SAG31_NODE_3386_length_4331_cov_2.421786_5_plen_196_part_00